MFAHRECCPPNLGEVGPQRGIRRVEERQAIRCVRLSHGDFFRLSQVIPWMIRCHAG